MMARQRITLWVGLAGFFAALVLPLIIFLWGLDSPSKFFDQELQIRARSVSDELTRELQGGTGMDRVLMDYFSHLYWLRIYDEQGKVFYGSRMAREIDLPRRSATHGYLIRTDVPLHRFYTNEGNKPATFWNRLFTVRINGGVYVIHVARPVASLFGASATSALMIGSTLLVATLFLIFVSYSAAGRILQPVQRINQLTKEITEDTLKKRIPLTGNYDEFDELTTSLNAMFSRLQSSFERQHEFIANASHELKTPLTLLRLSTEELMQEDLVPDVLQEKLLAQDRALARMNQLVKSLLDLSRLERSDQLVRAVFSLDELLQDVLLEFQLLFQEKQLTLECQIVPECVLSADQEKIRRLLINLLDNAIRYNCPGGMIRCCLERDTQGVTLTIANTGPGIGLQERGRIFEQFYRSEWSRAAVHGGSGLGLTIVQRIVALHGGTIAVVDGEPGWTTMVLQLPVACPSDGSAQEHAAAFER